MRTLNSVLQDAMDSGNFTPIVRAAVLDPDDYTVEQYLNLVYFKINGLDIEIEFYDPSGTFSDAVSLERGVKVGDTEYTIFSGIYKLRDTFKVRGGELGLYSATGSLIEPSAVNVNGNQPYIGVIGDVLALGSVSGVFKTPAAPWIWYTFLPFGSFFHTSNIYTFFTLLKQKYLIYATDNGPDSLMFFSIADTLALASQYTLSLTDRDTWSISSNYRQFIWKDEAGTIHQPGPANYPIHNLGYLENACSPPVVPDNNLPIGETVIYTIPNLKYQTGDCVSFDPGIGGYSPIKSVLDVTEIYDTRGSGRDGARSVSSLAWRMELRPLRYFNPTEGGQIDRSAQYTTTYAPLSTSGFVGLLDSHVTNLQALADAVDVIPAALLNVDNVGNFSVSGYMGIGNSGSASYKLYVSQVLSDAVVSEHILTQNTFTISPTADAWGAYIALNMQLNATPAAGISLGYPIAFRGTLVTSTGNVYSAVCNLSAFVSYNGTVYEYSGIKCTADNFGAAWSYYYGLNITSPSIWGGSLANLYGIYIGDMSVGGTLNYGIFTNAGLIRFGDQVSVIGCANRIQVLVKGYSSQVVNLQEWQTSAGALLTCIAADGTYLPLQKPTASAPTYVKGAMYFDTTLNKLRIGGAAAWQTVTSV